MRDDARSEASLGSLFQQTSRSPRNEEIAWYQAALPRDGTILDAMAGPGRLLVPLIEAGFRVHGAESSARALAECRELLDARGFETELFRQNVAALNLPFRYAAAFIGSGSFQRLTDRAAALEALLRIRAHLVAPAKLLLDLFVPMRADHPPGAAVVEVQTVSPLEGCRIGLRTETSIDVAEKRIDVVRRYERRDALAITAREDESLSLTWYSEEEASALLRAAGYGRIETDAAGWGGDDERRFALIAHAD